MQICAASRQFSGRVNQHPIRRADHAHQLAFCHHGAASHTSALGNMLHALNRFLRHLQLNFPIPCPLQHKRTRERRMLYSSASSSSPRLWILRPTTSPRSSSSTNSTPFFFFFLPFFLSSSSSSAAPVAWKISGFILNNSSSETPSLAFSSSSSSGTAFFGSFLTSAGIRFNGHRFNWSCFCNLR